MKNETRYTIDRAALHISEGNGKTGKIPTFNKLSGAGYQRDKNGAKICNIQGTCAQSCAGCYAMRSQSMCRENVIRAWGENTALARDPRALYFEMRNWFETHPAKAPETPFRIHSSGEFETLEELEIWAYLAANAAKDAGYILYTYTKRFDLLEQFVKLNDGRAPENLIINLSEWGIYTAPQCLRGLFPRFVWDCGEERAAKMPHCPAVLEPEKEGGRGKRNAAITCDKCRRCWSHKSTAVYNH